MNTLVHLNFNDSTPTYPNCFTPLPIFPDVVALIILTLGTLLAPVPQIVKLIIRKDVEGINLHSFLFGAITTIAIALDGVLTNWPRFSCCSLISPWNCFQSLLSFLQVFSNWLANFIIFFLIAYYVKNTTDHPKAKLKARLIFTLYCLWFLIGGSILTIFLAPYGKSLKPVKILALVWTIISTTSIIIQWLPQIITTWKHKSSGSLSLITLLINGPGAFVTMTFLIRSKQSPGTYLPFFLSGCVIFLLNSPKYRNIYPFPLRLQQVILIIMLLYFAYKKRKLKKKKKDIQTYTLTDDYIEDEISRSLMPDESSDEQFPVLEDSESFEYNGS